MYSRGEWNLLNNRLPSGERVRAYSGGPDVQMICGSVGKKGNVSESCESVRVCESEVAMKLPNLPSPSSHPAGLFTSSGNWSLGYSVQWGGGRDCDGIQGGN